MSRASTLFLHALLLLLALPALLVPRGVALSWCLCASVEGQCCGEAEQPPCCASDQDCNCCVDVDLDDDQPWDKAPSAESLSFVLHPAHGAALAATMPPKAAQLRILGGRAPPDAVTPTGLLPGVFPLRL